MEAKKPPIYMVSLGRVYRRDEITATRFPIFHQFEGLAVDRNLTLSDLKGTLLHVMRALYGEDRAGAVPDALLPVHGAVDRAGRLLPDLRHGRAAERASTRAGSRWAAPAWWIRRCFSNVGIDPEEWTGFAFGCGIERAAQLRHGIPEIRPFWENDLRVLRQF